MTLKWKQVTTNQWMAFASRSVGGRFLITQTGDHDFAVRHLKLVRRGVWHGRHINAWPTRSLKEAKEFADFVNMRAWLALEGGSYELDQKDNPGRICLEGNSK